MNKNGRDYKTICLYIDEKDPYQKALMELLNLVPRKKTQFLALVANDFISSFKDPSKINAKIVNDYIQWYELNSQRQGRVPVAITEAESKPQYEHEQEKKKASKAKEQNEPQSKVSMEAANKMMSSFMA